MLNFFDGWKPLRQFGCCILKYRLLNTITARFNAILGEMIEMSQRKPASWFEKAAGFLLPVLNCQLTTLFENKQHCFLCAVSPLTRAAIFFTSAWLGASISLPPCFSYHGRITHSCPSPSTRRWPCFSSLVFRQGSSMYQNRTKRIYTL